MDTKEMFHSLTSDELKSVTKARVLLSLFEWKTGQMPDGDVEPVTKAMFIEYMDSLIDLLGILQMLDGKVMHAAYILYGHLFENEAATQQPAASDGAGSEG